MKEKIGPVNTPPLIPEAITYIQKMANSELAERGQKTRQIEALYLQEREPLREYLIRLVKSWGDQPAVRQILFYHYLHQEPLLKEVLQHCIYPVIRQNKQYRWKETDLKFFLHQIGLTESEQNKSCKIIEKTLSEMKLFSTQGQEKIIEYQRPSVEAVAYAFYAEYGDGFEQGRRFHLKNPPLEQILEYAVFPAYFLLDLRAVQVMLEACRMKNYISLEARGGLNQYALIYQDLPGFLEYMLQGGYVEC